MNAKLVERLARLEPRDSHGSAQPANAFCQIHLNPAFGWHIARAFARARVRFPETLLGRDHWLFRAYMMQLNPSAYPDPHVDEACHLSQRAISSSLKAMLIAGLGEPVSGHLDIVAQKLGISRRTVEAFEILFFNVLDRHQDGLYISHIVYPEGRQVEFDEHYFETASNSDLLLRAAYNHNDIGLVEHLSGIFNTYVNDLGARRDSEAELEKQLMGNELIMAHCGLLNQRSVGLQHVLKLLAASRSPRNKAMAVESTTDDLTSSALAAAIDSVAPITDTDHQDAQAASRPGQQYWSDETGKVFALDDPAELQNITESVDTTELTEMFPEVRHAIWRNKDTDMPVVIVGLMKSPGMPDHYLATSGTGLPVSEVSFED